MIERDFGVESTATQNLFVEKAVLSALTSWCEANDAIHPWFVTRSEYEQNRKDELPILTTEPDANGNRLIELPTNLRLWDLPPVVEAIDTDTFANSWRPERGTEAPARLRRLGQTLCDAGVYLAQRRNKIDKGQDLASEMASEFYDYGKALVTGQMVFTDFAEIQARPLDEDAINRAEEWLIGEGLSASRRRKAETAAGRIAACENRPLQKVIAEELEKQRQQTVNQYFAVADKSFELQTREVDGQPLKSTHIDNRQKTEPWRDPAGAHETFLRESQDAITRALEAPKQELFSAIFRRGVEFLQRQIGYDKLPKTSQQIIDKSQTGAPTLREALKIDDLRTELEAIKNVPAKRPWFRRRSAEDIKTKTIANKEREIADRIQEAVSRFLFDPSKDQPSNILAGQKMNCVGFSVLGATLMTEAGLKCLLAEPLGHCQIALVTSDGGVELRDLQMWPGYWPNIVLDDNDLTGQKPDKSPVTISDIAAVASKPNSDGVNFCLRNPRKHKPYLSQLRAVPLGKGAEHAFAHNFSNTLARYRNEEESILIGQLAATLDHGHASTYANLSVHLFNAACKEEALAVCRKAISLSDNYLPYSTLGFILSKLGRAEEAVAAYSKFLDKPGANKYPVLIEEAQNYIDRYNNYDA